MGHLTLVQPRSLSVAHSNIGEGNFQKRSTLKRTRFISGGLSREGGRGGFVAQWHVADMTSYEVDRKKRVNAR